MRSCLPVRPGFAAMLALAALVAPVAAGQGCTGVSTGLAPLSDLGAGLYQGFAGGLYPGGANTPPAAHLGAGVALAGGVVPRFADGSIAPPAAPGGRIVLCSLGMSNATQEFSAFVPTSNADVLRNPRLTVVDAAQGGITAPLMADPTHPYWAFVTNRLATVGATDAQVQVVWIKNALASPTGGFPAAATTLKTHLRAIVQNARAKFPNLRLAYLSSRTYAGYATTPLNPEPYAYESGFAVKWLVEDQIAGDPALNYDPANGPVVAPWIAWGPYLWADGLLGRSDGLFYECRDFAADGTHPGPLGRFKVAAMLDAFFRTDPTTAPWYVAAAPHAVSEGLYFYGDGAAGVNGVPLLTTTGGPEIGTVFNGLGVANAAPGAFGTVFLSAGYDDFAVTGGKIYVHLGALLAPSPTFATTFLTNASGNGGFAVAVPNDPVLMGLSLYAQIAVVDPSGQALPEFGGVSLTRGVRLIFGL